MRTAKIDQYPELKDTLAELLADNINHEKIAETMGVSDRGTVSEWAKRPEIQVRVTRLIREKANRILAKTTTKIEGHLDGDRKISLENLLKIHREFAGSLVRVETEGDATKALEELFMKAHDDDALAAAFAEIGIDAKADEAADIGIES